MKVYMRITLICSIAVSLCNGQIPSKSTTNDGDYNTLHRDGSYEFGYSNDDEGSSYHISQANRQNVVRGRFGSRDPETGGIKDTVYTAGPRGFRARGPNIHRKMDLDQRPRGPIGNKDDPYFDPNEDPSYSFGFKTPGYNKQEAANRRGDVSGRYSYVDDVGERHNVEYIAGKDTGFHVKSSYPDSNPSSIGPLFFSGPLVRGESKQRGHSSIQRGLDGSYRFISAGPDQRRSESSDANGNVRGSYTFLDDKGIQRTVNYIAGPGIGYRIIKNAKDTPHVPSFFPSLPDYRDPSLNKPFAPPTDDFGSNNFPDKEDNIDDLFGRPGGSAASGHVKPPAQKKPIPPVDKNEDNGNDIFDKNDGDDFGFTDNDRPNSGTRPSSRPDTKPDFTPSNRPDRPDTRPDRPDTTPDRPNRPDTGFGGTKPGTRPERPGTRPERPGTRPGGNDFNNQGGKPGGGGDFGSSDGDDDIFGKPSPDSNTGTRPTSSSGGTIKPTEGGIGLSPGFDVDEDDIFGLDKPSEGRPDSSNRPSSGGKPGYGERPSNGRPTNGRPSNGRPSNGRPSNGRPSNGRPSNGRPSNGRPSNGRPSNGRPSNGRPSNGRPSNGRPSNGDRPGTVGRPDIDGKPQNGDRPGDGSSSINAGKPEYGGQTPGLNKPGIDNTDIDDDDIFDKPSPGYKPDANKPGGGRPTTVQRPGSESGSGTGITIMDGSHKPGIGGNRPDSNGITFIDEDNDDDIFGSSKPESGSSGGGTRYPDKPGYKPGSTSRPGISGGSSSFPRPDTSSKPGSTIRPTSSSRPGTSTSTSSSSESGYGDGKPTQTGDTSGVYGSGKPIGPTGSTGQGGTSTTSGGFLDDLDNEGEGGYNSNQDDKKDKDKRPGGRPQIGISGHKHRGGTIFRNLGEESINFPPGASVRAHVQSIDILPFGSKTQSPSEAVEEELKKHGSR